MKFEELITLSEQPQEYILNGEGRKLIQEYLSFINELKKWVEPEVVVSLLSNIEATGKAKQIYLIAKRLSTLTGDGQRSINAVNYVINDNDQLMQYLDKR